MDDVRVLFLVINVAEYSVVRAHEDVIAGGNQYGPASRPDSRIDHCQVNGLFWEVTVAAQQRECRSVNIVRRDQVSDVDNLRRRAQCPYYSLDRRDVVVALAKIRC